MNIWLVMLVGGLITFAIRFSLIYLFGRIHVPEAMRRSLHYVPPAVLSAIIFPELSGWNPATRMRFVAMANAFRINSCFVTPFGPSRPSMGPRTNLNPPSSI